MWGLGFRCTTRQSYMGVSVRLVSRVAHSLRCCCVVNRVLVNGAFAAACRLSLTACPSHDVADMRLSLPCDAGLLPVGTCGAGHHRHGPMCARCPCCTAPGRPACSLNTTCSLIGPVVLSAVCMAPLALVERPTHAGSVICARGVCPRGLFAPDTGHVPRGHARYHVTCTPSCVCR